MVKRLKKKKIAIINKDTTLNGCILIFFDKKYWNIK